MKVILLKDVGGVGRHGEVKDASDGYALNYLIPNGFAIQATAEKIKMHAAMQQKESEQREKEQQALIVNIKSLENARIEITARATEKGGLFKSLGVSDIQKAIREQRNIELPPGTIVLAKPIKEVGEHDVELRSFDAKARLLLEVKKQS